MALEQNLSSIVNINRDTLVGAAKAAIASQKDRFVATLKSSVTENVKRLEEDVKDLGTQAIKAETDYKAQESKISLSRLTDTEKQERLSQLRKDYETERALINKNIEDKKTELANKLKSYLPQEVEFLRSKTKSISDTTSARLNDVKNGKKISIPNRSVITTVGVLSNFLISSITIGNKRIEKVVDRVNEQIKNIRTEQDIQKARLSVNRAKLIINQNRVKLQTVQTVILILGILIPLLDTILNLFKSNPVPSAVPPGIGVPLGVINTIDSKSKTLDDLKLAAVVILSIISQIIAKLIDDLNFQESRLLPIEGLLDSGLDNLSSAQIANLSAGLGYLKGYDYKGFRFFIKEEENPNFVVKGNKRRYAVALNRDGNEILQSEYSFTLSPDILIEELKLKIDEENLVA
jgi:hypothetical protein